MALGKYLHNAIEQSEKPRPRSKGSYDFLQHVDVADFLETLEVEKLHKTTLDEWQFSCPFDGHTAGDASPSAYMNDGSKGKSKNTLWKCHGCGRSGNAITFYAELEHISKPQAVQHIRETWAPGFRAPKGGSISAEFEERLLEKWEQEHQQDIVKTIAWEHYDNMFSVDWGRSAKRYDQHRTDDPAETYLFNRGFRSRTLERWRIGYDIISDRLTIPVTNVDGDLLGVKGRRPNDDRKLKYLILGDRQHRRPHYKFMPYEKSEVVYGLERARVETTTFVLCEGELDVMALDQCEIPAISTGSAHVSLAQARLIRDHVEELVVYFDSDNAGRNSTWGWEGKDGEWHPGLVERLAPFLRVRIVADHPHDPAKMQQLGQIKALRDLIAEAKAHHLIRHRPG